MNELLNILYYFAQLITLMLPNMALIYFYMYKEWKLTHISQKNEMCNTTLNYYTSKSEEGKILYTYYVRMHDMRGNMIFQQVSVHLI